MPALRVVFFGELESTFSRLHAAVLAQQTQVALWVYSLKPQTGAPRQKFYSVRDWLERFTTRLSFEWQTWQHLRCPARFLQLPRCPTLHVPRPNAALTATVTALQPDLIISAGFNRLLGLELLALPRLGAYNCHPSPLPAYAGHNPWFWLLRQGATQAGVSIHQMTALADEGPLVYQYQWPLRPHTTHQALYNFSAWQSAVGLRHCLQAWHNGASLVRLSQDLTQRTFFKSPQAADFNILWSSPAATIENLVWAATPAPNAWTLFQGRRWGVRRARALAPGSQGGLPGQVINLSTQGVEVACGVGSLHIQTALLEEQEIVGRDIANRLQLKLGSQLGT